MLTMLADAPEVAERLQAAGIPRIFGATETLVWEVGRTLHFAFRGDAGRINAVANAENRDGSPGMLRNVRHSLDAELQRAVGLDARVERSSWGYQITGGIGQTLDDDDAHFSQALDALASMIGTRVNREEEVHVTLMPKQGAPYVLGEDSTEYFNARTKRFEWNARPKWLTEVRVRREALDIHQHPGEDPFITVPAADICSLAPVTRSSSGPILGSVGGQEFLVSHSFDPMPYGRVAEPRLWASEAAGRRVVEESAELVRRCGGWIYPSCAVGKFASTTFGPVTLLAGVNLVLDGLSPRRPRGKHPVSLYDTDVWTPNTTDVIGLGGHVLFEQLCGYADYSMYTHAWVNHQWVLGPPVRTAGPEGPNARVLKSESDLRVALKRRYKHWREGMAPDEVASLVERASEEAEGWQFEVFRYPYMEAKLNTLVETPAWKMAFVAESWARDAEAFLERVGFEGTMHVVDDPPGASYEEGWLLSHDPGLAYLQSMRILEAVRRL